MCRLYGGIRTTILHNLINHNTTLSDPWLKTLEHNYFQTCRKLSESKTLNNYLCKISINIRINYKYMFVRIERSKMSKFENFHK